MNIIKIKEKKENLKCIRFLKEYRSCNLYLYEGIARTHPRYQNFFFTENGKIVAVIHTKGGASIHLFFSGWISDFAIKKVALFILRRFGGARIIFGDKDCLAKLIKMGFVEFKLFRQFFFMEIKKDQFQPIGTFKGYCPHFKEANLLLPLQIQYEMEEMEIGFVELSREKILLVLEKRLEQEEITAVFNKGKPVALAAVNARFEDICQIGSVYVLPEFRGKGYGFSVISSHLERLFKKYRKIALFVNKNNKRAYHVYEKVGFYPVAELMQINIVK